MIILKYEINDEELAWNMLQKEWHNPLRRQMYAKQGMCLNVLMHDEKPAVRKQVAEQGYGLDVLKNDKNAMVEMTAILADWGVGQHDKKT